MKFYKCSLFVFNFVIIRTFLISLQHLKLLKFNGINQLRFLLLVIFCLLYLIFANIINL